MDPIAADLFGLDQTGVTIGTGTGQQGHAPLFSGDGTVGDAFSDVWEWLNQPFKNPMSPIGIGLTVGAVLIAVIIWNLILYHVRIAAETL